MGERILQLAQFLVLARLRLEGIKLVELVAQIFLVALPLRKVILRLAKLAARLGDAGIESAVLREEFGVVGKGIDDAQLEGGILEEEVAVLRMDVKQAGGNLPQDSDVDRRVVDEGATLAVGSHLTAKDALGGLVVQFVFLEDGLHVVAFDVEDALHGTLGSAGHDAARFGPLSHEQTEGAKDDGLAGARLAGHDGETRLQVDVEGLDEDVVIDGQVGEHCIELRVKS